MIFPARFNQLIIGSIIGLLMLSCPKIAAAALIYYNDGTVNDFDEVFGDVGIGVAWNESFEDGGFMDGTPDDIPPFNTIDNQGLVTRQGAAGGVAGGGFRKILPGAMQGAVIVTYGSMGKEDNKAPAGVKWIANAVKLGELLNVDPRRAVEIWKEEGIVLQNGLISKLDKYIGDPIVSIPPNDLPADALYPIDFPTVSSALTDDNVLIFFWEVTGSREMDSLDLLLGDFEGNTGYQDFLHHYPYLAVLGDVRPSDFGIDPTEAVTIQFNGDSLPGTDPFVGSMAIVTKDPASVPEPATILGLATVLGFGALLKREHSKKQKKG